MTVVRLRSHSVADCLVIIVHVEPGHISVGAMHVAVGAHQSGVYLLADSGTVAVEVLIVEEARRGDDQRHQHDQRGEGAEQLEDERVHLHFTVAQSPEQCLKVAYAHHGGGGGGGGGVAQVNRWQVILEEGE